MHVSEGTSSTLGCAVGHVSEGTSSSFAFATWFNSLSYFFRSCALRRCIRLLMIVRSRNLPTNLLALGHSVHPRDDHAHRVIHQINLSIIMRTALSTRTSSCSSCRVVLPLPEHVSVGFCAFLSLHAEARQRRLLRVRVAVACVTGRYIDAVHCVRVVGPGRGGGGAGVRVVGPVVAGQDEEQAVLHGRLQLRLRSTTGLAPRQRGACASSLQIRRQELVLALVVFR